MSINEHDYRVCTIDDCDDCQELVDGGFIIACGECDHIGSSDCEYPSWQIQKDGRVLCQGCAEGGRNHLQ